jgi:UDP-galactopyranose mutase
VRLASEVVGVLTAEGRVGDVVLAGGSRLAADVVVSAIDPRTLFGRLVAHPSTRQVLARMDRSPTALPPEVTHLGLAGAVPVLPAETVLHGDPW